MMSRKLAVVEQVQPLNPDAGDWDRTLQRITTQFGTAINFTEFAGMLAVGDTVLLNRTANDLNLGTGGDDFVIARIAPPPEDTKPAERGDAHIMRLRYTPLQHSVSVVEDDPQFAHIWGRRLDNMAVVAGALHSQLAPVASAAELHSWLASTPLRPKWTRRTTPVVTDSAALSISTSRLIGKLWQERFTGDPIIVGQAFGGDFQTVTMHNALLFAKQFFNTDCAFVCQGPGNTGTNTKYGFSGIEQASNLDIAAALGGTPIACVRASSGDARERHQGISHHTLTVLELVRSRCIVPLPEGLEAPPEWLERHDVRIIPLSKTQPALDLLKKRGINVTTMGRGIDEDPLFFHAAAAAGVVAAEISAAQATA